MSNLRRLICTLTTLLLLGPFCVNAHAERYVVGVENIDYYPLYAFSYRGSYAEALLSRFAEAEKLQLLYSPEPITRLYHGLLESGSLDLKYPDNPNWATELKEDKKVHYSKGLSYYTDGVYVLPKNLGRDRSQFKTLGVLRGFTPVAFEDLLLQRKVRLVTHADLGQLLLMALRGEIDGVYANMDLSHHWLTHTIKRPHGLVFDSSLPFERGEYHLSTIKHPELIERFNQFLEREGPLVKELKDQYGIMDHQELPATEP